MNILSVDIDFLFTDMKEIQKKFDTELPPIRSWKLVGWKSKGKKFEPCKDSAKFLDTLLNKSIFSCTKVFKIDEHNEIIDVLKEVGAKDSNVFNVDYHHDIMYSDDNNEEISIENWVMKGRKLGLIKSYSWICQDDSERCRYGAVKHYMYSWKDLDFNNLPKMDVVVLCTSKHFTPPKYWGLCEKIEKELNYKIEKLISMDKKYNFIKNKNYLQKFYNEDNKDYFLGEKSVSDFIFEKNKIYFDVIIDEDNGVPFLSVLNVGEKSNIWECEDFCKDIIGAFGKIGFQWKTGIKNEVMIKRLITKFNVIKKFEGENISSVILGGLNG